MTEYERYGGKGRITTYVEQEQSDELHRMADMLGMTMAAMIRRILIEFLQSGDVSAWLEEYTAEAVND